jgi:ankyrin repeat protein
MGQIGIALFSCLSLTEQQTRTLLSQGADVYAQGGDCGSALHAASAEGHDQIVQRLLKEGAAQPP